MDNKDIKELVDEETNRIKNLLTDYNVKEKKIEMLKSVIENTAWMKVKLDDTRETIKTSNVVIPYDNGGGQKGLRENPLFKGYESLWKSYMAGMSKIIDSLPNEEAKAEIKTIETPKTMLELVRDKHRKEA